MNKIYLTWDDINHLVDILATEINSYPTQPIYVTGLARGGLIPAVMLSHKTDLKYISSEDLSTVSHIDVLIVDDIADSGETLSQYTAWNTAVLHYKLQSEHIPTYYAEIVPDNIWVSYPWEKDDARPIQDYLK
jgi:uncharacterized protein